MRLIGLALAIFLSGICYGQQSSLNEFEKGIEAYNQGDYETAYLLIDTWLRDHPRDPEGYYYLGLIYEQFDGTSDLLALENYQKAISLDPAKADVYLSRGRLYLKLKRFEQAEEDFLTFRSIPKGETTQVIYRIGSADQGVSQIFTAQTSNPSQILYHLALAKIGLEDYSAASVYLDSVIYFNPEEADFWAEKGHVEMLSGSEDKALESLRQAVTYNPDHFLARQRIKILENGNDVDQLEELTLAIAKDPEDPQPWKIRGYVKFMQGDFEGSIEDYTEAINLYPEDEEGWFYRAKSYAKQKNWQAAESDFEEVLFLIEQDPEALLGRGQARYYQNELEAALADFVELIAIDPSNPSAFYHRAITLHRLERKAEACSDMNTAVELGMTGIDEIQQKICNGD
ncbi:tetratricopeptide repeat protein [Algoriphagus vanfongensis]|uniref:tetratricopeptide repeat protein n=1 Tax=Algoriphagus vanfongensis TaxID=426371 RepID=UPI00040D21B8|nr:tetratricopeptide repeat protein [Algoriphagus vanfongensis]